MDKDASATEDAVWSALMNPSISRKAGLHAYAITCALEGGELVIPPQPGVSPGLALHRDYPRQVLCLHMENLYLVHIQSPRI